MKLTKKIARASVVALFVAFYALALVRPSYTYPNYMTEARAQKYPASNCSYCHSSLSGGRGWNERGQWLIAQKKKRKADTINVAWLKDYHPSEAKDSASTPKR